MDTINLHWDKDVTGPLSSRFSELPDLQYLNLWNTKVFGNIAALQNLRKLEKLYLMETKVSGNIAALENLMELKDLRLVETNVIGDIGALKNLTKLKELRLRKTKVSGNLAALQNLRELEILDLYNTMVFGDLAALQGATKLQSLNLYNTTVFGDLAAFQTATRLTFQKFEVSNTNITCPQEAALKAVLVKLGFQEQQLHDLHALDGLAWMLCSRSSLTFYCLATYGLAFNCYWEQRMFKNYEKHLDLRT